MQKKILIFGSSGFIGCALSGRFAEKGYQVFGCDIVSASQNTPHVFFTHDLLENNPSEIFSHNYDICINCAGSASVPYSFENPFKDYELNTRIVFKILSELSKVKSNARFINLSSAAVYGNPKHLPIKENDALQPISPYGNHKLMSEMIVEQFRTYFGIDAISLRIFSAYGPGLKKQIFWDIYQKALRSDCIEMLGTGNESRDFIFISDLVQAISLIAESKSSMHQVYNIANGEEITIHKVVDTFCALYPKSLTYKFSGHARLGDPNNWRADISRLQALGYAPQYSIEKGITELVKWIQAGN